MKVFKVKVKDALRIRLNDFLDLYSGNGIVEFKVKDKEGELNVETPFSSYVTKYGSMFEVESFDIKDSKLIVYVTPESYEAVLIHEEDMK